jgi:hypothetical protein
MTKRLEEELAAWMRQQADQTEHGTDLAPGAFRKSRKIRRRRRIAIVAVAAAALVVVVSAGTQAMNLATPDQRDQVVNTPTRSAEPTPTQSKAPTPLPANSKPVVLDFDKLPRGTPNVAWWDAQTRAIRWGEQRLPLGLEGTPAGFGWVGSQGDNRYVRFQNTGEVGARLELVGGDATQPLTDEAGTFAVSADGKQVAFTTGKDRGVSVASDAGEVLHRKTFGFTPEVTGFVGSKLVISASYEDRDETHAEIWDLDTDRVRTIEGALSAQSTAPAKGLVAVRTGNPSVGDELCSAVIDVNDGDRELWRGGCGMDLVSLSPDGRYAVLSPPTEGDVTDVPYTFVDLRNGRDVLKLQAASWNGIAWEPGGAHVVLNAFDDDQNALVRCDLFGTCELVSTPLVWEDSNFYDLPIN